MQPQPLFDRIRWRDPVGGARLEPLVAARAPGGVPLCGALRIPGGDRGYPIVDSVVRLTPQLAQHHSGWLETMGLRPAETGEPLQRLETVENFGFQWGWNPSMRSDSDLLWRVASQFGLVPAHFSGKTVLDAGAGAGDQSRWLLRQGAEVVSVDLSPAIDVVAGKLRLDPRWVGVQGDVTMLPFGDRQFDVSYCEGVLHHTRDTTGALRELKRVLTPGGSLLATHYEAPRRLRGRLRMANARLLQRKLAKLDRYKLQFVTGVLAALAFVPLLGRVVRLSGSALWDERMPNFSTTWTNTLDFYATHGYQRFVSGEELRACFDAVGGLERLYASGTTVAARRLDP